jgi:hypothetical protein
MSSTLAPGSLLWLTHRHTFPVAPPSMGVTRDDVGAPETDSE